MSIVAKRLPISAAAELLFVITSNKAGYVFVVVCLCVCLLATLRKNFLTDSYEIFREGLQLANEQMVKFWWRSASPSGYWDCFPDSMLLGDRESLTALQL